MAKRDERRPHRWSVEHDRIITEMWQQGIEPRAIASHLRVTTVMVVDRALRLSLAPVRRKYKPATLKKGARRAAPVSYAATCQWIEGDPVQLVRSGAQIFCGCRSQPGSSYCAAHHKICYVPPAPPTIRLRPAL